MSPARWRAFRSIPRRRLLRNLVQGLRSDDTFNVVCFASGSGVLSEEPLAANPANVALANEFIDGQTAGGGTELEAALKRALALPGGENRSRSILLITDGFISADAEVRRTGPQTTSARRICSPSASAPRSTAS